MLELVIENDLQSSETLVLLACNYASFSEEFRGILRSSCCLFLKQLSPESSDQPRYRIILSDYIKMH